MNIRGSLALPAVLSFVMAFGVGCSDKGNDVSGEAPMAYVTNQNGGVSVIDLNTFEVVSEYDVEGKGPRGIGITKDGKSIIVANVDGGDVSIIDRKTGAVTKHIPIGENPEFVRVIAGRAYISFEPASLGGPPPKPGSEEAKKLEEEREEDDAEPAKIAVVDLEAGEVADEIGV